MSMRDFTLKDREALIEFLKARCIMSEEQADHFTHALLDIRESVIEIYDDYLPRLQHQLETNTGDVRIRSGTFAKHADTSTITSKMLSCCPTPEA